MESGVCAINQNLVKQHFILFPKSLLLQLFLTNPGTMAVSQVPHPTAFMAVGNLTTWQYVWQHSPTHAARCKRSKLEPDLQYSHQVRAIHWRPELTSTYNGNMNNTNLKSIPSDTIETFNALQCIGGTCCSIPPLNENTLRA